MGRTKGALSRKTLAKQLGISLEEYLELEKNGKLEEYRAEHGIVDAVSSSIPNQKLQEHKQEVKEELKAKKISKTGKTPSVSPNYKPSEKLTTSTKPNITKDTIIILPGKEAENLPKTEAKISDTSAKVKNIPSVSEENVEAKKSKIDTPKVNTLKAKPNETLCSRCHKLILKDSSFRLILSNMIPGIASYHYNVDDKQILCYDCAHGLATIIEEYFEDEDEDDLASDNQEEEINDTNVKEMVKPSDSSGNEEEDLIF